MSELKSCPFCGGNAKLGAEPNDYGLSPLLWYVECEKCGVLQYQFISDHDAIEAWNRRVGDADE